MQLTESFVLLFVELVLVHGAPIPTPSPGFGPLGLLFGAASAVSGISGLFHHHHDSSSSSSSQQATTPSTGPQITPMVGGVPEIPTMPGAPLTTNEQYGNPYASANTYGANPYGGNPYAASPYGQPASPYAQSMPGYGTSQIQTGITSMQSGQYGALGHYPNGYGGGVY